LAHWPLDKVSVWPKLQSVSKMVEKSCQYLIDKIHTYAEHLQAKQDGIINASEKRASLHSGEGWKGRTRGMIDLQLHWVPAHSDFEPNERADEEAKRAAQGLLSEAKLLPKILHRSLPASVPALRQNHDNCLLKRWKCWWRSSPRHRAIHLFDDSMSTISQLVPLSHPRSWAMTSIHTHSATYGTHQVESAFILYSQS
jgi:hypothetical protein